MKSDPQVKLFAELVDAIRASARAEVPDDEPVTPSEREQFDDDAAMDAHYGENVAFIDEHSRFKR